MRLRNKNYYIKLLVPNKEKQLPEEEIINIVEDKKNVVLLGSAVPNLVGEPCICVHPTS